MTIDLAELARNLPDGFDVEIHLRARSPDAKLVVYATDSNRREPRAETLLELDVLAASPVGTVALMLDVVKSSVEKIQSAPAPWKR